MRKDRKAAKMLAQVRPLLTKLSEVMEQEKPRSVIKGIHGREVIISEGTWSRINAIVAEWRARADR